MVVALVAGGIFKIIKQMKKLSKTNMLGMIIFLIAIGLSWYWFNWKMPIIIFLFIMGNNMERNGRF